MDRKIKIYIAFLVVLFALIIYADSNQPKTIDWSPNYSLQEKTPFGLYVFDQEYQKIIKKNN